MLLPEFANTKWYQELTWSLRASQTCFRESITVRTSAQVRFPFNETDEQLIKTQQWRNQGRRDPAGSRGPKGPEKHSLRCIVVLQLPSISKPGSKSRTVRCIILKSVEGFNCYIFNSLKPDIWNKSLYNNNLAKWNKLFLSFLTLRLSLLLF